MTTSEIISFAVGIIGILISVFAFIRAEQQKKHEIFRYKWEQVHLGTRRLAIKVFRSHKPEIIFCSSGASAIVANLLMIEANTYVPLFLGLSEKNKKDDFVPPETHSIVVKTTNWTTYIPNELAKLKNQKLLIVEDCVISGETLFALKDKFSSLGFENEKVITMALVVSDFALEAKKGPDLKYYNPHGMQNIYLPWGKGKGNDL